jgi:hypothetical protein
MRRHLVRWLTISLGIFLVLVAGCVVILGKSIDDLWVEETLDQATSPDGRCVAGVFRRDGGVFTNGMTRHVNLRRGSDPFPRSSRGTLDDGLVYITGRETWGVPIKLNWKDAEHLVIRAPLVDTSKTRWQDVSITYEAELR